MAQNAFTSLLDSFFGEMTVLGLGQVPAPAPEPTVDIVRLDLSAHLRDDAHPVVKASPSPVGGVSVVDLGSGTQFSSLSRQPNVELFRNYARYSTWVRAAIDYHRRMLGRAKYEIVAEDSTHKLRRLDKRVKSEVEDLLRYPNEAGESYGLLKEQWIEDYLVVGHGCIELALSNDLTARGMRLLDAGNIGFVRSWDGSDNKVPRFVEFSDKFGSVVKRYLAHQQVLCLVNRPMSNTKLGFSHVEALHRTILALLSGDEFLVNQILQPIPDSLVNLGEGVTKQQVDEFRYQIQQVKNKFAIIGGPKSAQVLRLAGTAEEFQILDGQEWFVRQVAATFGISTAKLKLSVDTSRANTEAMMTDDLEAITGELTRIQELETATFIHRYSYLGDVNLEFSYPIMHRKDERQQANIARTATGQPWTSVNEARMRTGEKPLEENDYLYVNEPIMNTKQGPVPMSIWQRQMEELEKNIGKKPEETEPAKEPAEEDDAETQSTDE